MADLKQNAMTLGRHPVGPLVRHAPDIFPPIPLPAQLCPARPTAHLPDSRKCLLFCHAQVDASSSVTQALTNQHTHIQVMDSNGQHKAESDIESG